MCLHDITGVVVGGVIFFLFGRSWNLLAVVETLAVIKAVGRGLSLLLVDAFQVDGLMKVQVVIWLAGPQAIDYLHNEQPFFQL